jgi:hypothetical protein
MKATVKFTTDRRPAPASRTFGTLLSARRYEMECPDYAAQIAVNGVAFDLSTDEWAALECGETTEAGLIRNYAKNTRLTAREEKSLLSAV